MTTGAIVPVDQERHPGKRLGGVRKAGGGEAVTTIVLHGDACSRCNKTGLELHPFKWAGGFITHRGRRIDHPWLCFGCIKAEKKKLYAKEMKA